MVGISPMKGIALAVLLATGLPSALAEETSASPDEILLKNGSRIVGTVTGSRDGVVSIDTDFAGTLSVSQDQIQSMTTTTPVVLRLGEDKVTPEQPLLVKDEQLLVVEADGSSGSYALADLTATNPEPWELGIGYQWTGLVSFAWSLERGNSDTDELDYKIDTQWLSDNDRYTVRLNGEIDEANDVKNTDNWTLIGKYDYFLDGPWYVGALAAAESDEFTDLDLRYWLGPYAGRKFFTEPVLSLEGELGLVYVNEDFIVAEDQDYPGANWNVHLTSNYLGGDSNMYVDHIGIWNLDETSDLILNTTFGVSFPLVLGLEGAAEILIEYDSGAVEGVDEVDQTYKFRIGYSW